MPGRYDGKIDFIEESNDDDTCNVGFLRGLLFINKYNFKY